MRRGLRRLGRLSSGDRDHGLRNHYEYGIVPPPPEDPGRHPPWHWPCLPSSDSSTRPTRENAIVQTTGTLITASVAALLAAVSPVIADEHHHRGGGGDGWHGGGAMSHGGAWHEHHGGECGWSCSRGLGALAFGGVLAALLSYAPRPVYYSPPAYVQPPPYQAARAGEFAT